MSNDKQLMPISKSTIADKEMETERPFTREELVAIERFKQYAPFTNLTYLGREIDHNDFVENVTFFSRQFLCQGSLPHCNTWSWNQSTRQKFKKIGSVRARIIKLNGRRKSESYPMPGGKVWIFQVFSVASQAFLFSFFWCEKSLTATVSPTVTRNNSTSSPPTTRWIPTQQIHSSQSQAGITSFNQFNQNSSIIVESPNQFEDVMELDEPCLLALDKPEKIDERLLKSLQFVEKCSFL